MKTFKRDELLTASEVARYVYCKRAWWYDHRVRRETPLLLRLVPLPYLAGTVIVALLVAIGLVIGLL